MEDYYPGELAQVVKAWSDINGGKRSEDKETDPMTFFGTGGEIIDS